MSSIDAIQQRIDAQKAAFNKAITDLHEIENTVNSKKPIDTKVNQELREKIDKFNQAILQAGHVISPESIAAAHKAFKDRVGALNETIKSQVSVFRRILWAIGSVFGLSAMLAQFDTKKFAQLAKDRAIELDNAKLLSDHEKEYLVLNRTIDQIKEFYNSSKELFPAQACVAIRPTKEKGKLQLLILEGEKSQIFDLKKVDNKWTIRRKPYSNLKEEFIKGKVSTKLVAYKELEINAAPVERLNKMLNELDLAIGTPKLLETMKTKAELLFKNKNYDKKPLFALIRYPHHLTLKVFYKPQLLGFVKPSQEFKVVITPENKILLHEDPPEIGTEPRVFGSIKAFQDYLGAIKPLIETENVIRALEEQYSRDQVAINAQIKRAFTALKTDQTSTVTTVADSAEGAQQYIENMMRYLDDKDVDNRCVCVRVDNHLQLYYKQAHSDTIGYFEVRVQPPHFTVTRDDTVTKYNTLKECYDGLGLQPFTDSEVALVKAQKAEIQAARAQLIKDLQKLCPEDMRYKNRNSSKGFVDEFFKGLPENKMEAINGGWILSAPISGLMQGDYMPLFGTPPDFYLSIYSNGITHHPVNISQQDGRLYVEDVPYKTLEDAIKTYGGITTKDYQKLLEIAGVPRTAVKSKPQAQQERRVAARPTVAEPTVRSTTARPEEVRARSQAQVQTYQTPAWWNNTVLYAREEDRLEKALKTALGPARKKKNPTSVENLPNELRFYLLKGVDEILSLPSINQKTGEKNFLNDLTKGRQVGRQLVKLVTDNELEILKQIATQENMQKVLNYLRS